MRGLRGADAGHQLSQRRRRREQPRRKPRHRRPLVRRVVVPPRLEGAVAFPRLLTRFPDIAAAGAPVRRDSFLLRGFDELPVTI